MKNKIVFVTGGASGIGRAIVSQFCHQGADVTFCDVDAEAGCQLVEHMGDRLCSFVHVDVADAQALEQAVQQVIDWKGNIDILINNVGVSRFVPLLDLSISDFDAVLHINLRSTFVTSRTLAKHREAHPEYNSYGRIINMASTRYLMSEPHSEVYAASKGGIVSLTHALAMSLSAYHITVNSISPGWVEVGDYATLRSSDHQQHPSGRVGRPEDIARMCLYLCQEENDFINAQNIVIDGGMTKKMIYEE